MKKVLIVGGAGYIGGYMTDLLRQSSNYQVTVYDNLLYEARYLKDVPFIFGDIQDTAKLASILPGYDIVIWLAALVGDGACAVNLPLTQALNTTSVQWLVDNYRGKIVFMSTCSVYGINHELIDEDAAPNPLSAYASTKLAAEQYIRANAKDYLIFRLGTLYGVGDAFSRMRFDLVVNILTYHAFSKGKISVFGGQQWRPILHVRDVAHAVEYCLDREISGLYNLSQQNVVISELAGEVKRWVPDTEVQYQDIKFEDLRDYRVVSDRIAATGWKPQYNLADGIQGVLRILQENRVKDPQDPIYYNATYIKTIF